MVHHLQISDFPFSKEFWDDVRNKVRKLNISWILPMILNDNETAAKAREETFTVEEESQESTLQGCAILLLCGLKKWFHFVR